MRRASLSVVTLALLGACGDDAAQTTGSGGSPSTSSTGGSGGGEGGANLACAEAPALTTSALGFDGTAGVSMGPAPGLGAEQFTLMAWVRRDGDGVEAGTGNGGIRHVPLVTKGRGETDGTTADCNYAMGFVGEVLGADFEDMDSGGNHPVIGSTPLDRGRWYHVAATYDGARFRLYVNGVLDAERLDDATPRYDSIQHFALGTAINSTGGRAGALHGALDEVRVYGRALGEAELVATMYTSTPTQSGLLGHFPLEASEGQVLDASGHGHHGDATAAGFVSPGPVLDRGHAPRIEAASAEPAPGQALRLSVDLSDIDGDELRVRFYTRELGSNDEFTVVVLPDTQYYTRNAAPPERPVADDPSYFYDQTRWAVDHRQSQNVVGLLHVGDIINNADVNAQWVRADQAMSILEQATDAAFPHGIPYGVSFGNHDQFPRDVASATVAANQWFGPARFAGRGYYGGNFDGDNDDSWVRFRAGDLEIVVVNLQFDTAPNPAVLDWAKRVFETHPRALGIVNSHYIVTTGGNFSAQGREIYEALKAVPNVQLMASGHVYADARRTDEYEGNVIHSMLSDFQRAAPDPQDPNKPIMIDQSTTNGGLGYMRIWKFSPAEQKLHVRTYSPKRDASYTDERNEFSLDVDLVGAGGPWADRGLVAAVGGRAELVVPGFEPGKAIEWYAVATDCEHETPSEVALARAAAD